MENGIRPPIQMAVDSMRSLRLGNQGEQNAQLIRIDVSKWLEKWPGAGIDLMLALPGEKASYPAKTLLQDGELLFLPGFGDTQKAGHGVAYVVATLNGTHVAVSDTVLTEILPKGRDGDELPEAPEAQAGWVADVLDAAHRAEEAAKRAENAGGGTITDEQIKAAVDVYLTENPIEVPAYELPTASADTLGGVKVGSGLRMDGDALGVEEKKTVLLMSATLEKEQTEIAEFEYIDPDGSSLFDKYKAIMIYTYLPKRSTDVPHSQRFLVMSEKATLYNPQGSIAVIDHNYNTKASLYINWETRPVITVTQHMQGYGSDAYPMIVHGVTLHFNANDPIGRKIILRNGNILVPYYVPGTEVEFYGVRW